MDENLGIKLLRRQASLPQSGMLFAKPGFDMLWLADRPLTWNMW